MGKFGVCGTGAPDGSKPGWTTGWGIAGWVWGVIGPEIGGVSRLCCGKKFICGFTAEAKKPFKDKQ